MNVTATLRCVATGETKQVDGGAWASIDDASFMWRAGQYSCDCTRSMFFHNYDRAQRVPCGSTAFELDDLAEAVGFRDNYTRRSPGLCPRMMANDEPDEKADAVPASRSVATLVRETASGVVGGEGPASPAGHTGVPAQSRWAAPPVTKRPTSADLKARVPFEEVWHRLGLGEFPGKEKVIRSPLRPDDKNPSFSLFQFKGEWRWRDHATTEGGDSFKLIEAVHGCDFPGAVQVMYDWIGYVPPVSASKGSAAPGGRLTFVASYPYLDAQGKLVFEKRRMKREDGSKTFLWRRPAREGETYDKKVAKRDANGDWWLWTKGGVEPILYRLPEILNADPSVPIYLVEGEKDANNAAAERGWVTTTVPDGAKSWRTSFREYFRGRIVKIVPDNDQPGRDLAQRILKDLMGFASQASVIDLRKVWPGIPEHGDVSDYLEWRRQQAATPASP